MKILFIVDRFSGQIPTGVISYRIADELVALGNEVIVLSAYSPGIVWNNGAYYQNKKIRHYFPPKCRMMVSNLFQINLNSYKWRTSMCALAAKIIESNKPDVIYARSTPVSICEIAAQLSCRTKLPVLMHFTDPIPAPIEWDSNMLYRRRMIKTMNRILPKATRISFGNSAMLEYEQSIVKCHFKDKAFVSPDPVPSSGFYYTPKHIGDEICFVYLGALYGNRNPQPLFEALTSLNESGVSLKLVIYDDNRVGTVLPPFASFVGRTNNVKRALLSSDILIDLDGDDMTPVFISSKIKEYLCCGRPILSITPFNSPSHKMTTNLNTVFHSNNNAGDILKTIRKIMNCHFAESDYRERDSLIYQFSPQSISKQIDMELHSIVVR